MVSAPQPQPDPTLVAQQQAAQAQQVQQIQQSLGDQQLNMLRQFGQTSAMAAAGTAPASSGGMFRGGTGTR